MLLLPFTTEEGCWSRPFRSIDFGLSVLLDDDGDATEVDRPSDTALERASCWPSTCVDVLASEEGAGGADWPLPDILGFDNKTDAYEGFPC